MRFKLTPICHAVAAVCVSAVSCPIHAQGQASQQLQRVEVTGSNIKRVDAETVAPVVVITREEIQRTGQPTVADVLRNLPQNSGGSFGESFANSFAPGAAGVSLRSLGEKTTLVLINGRRIAGYGFAQNISDTFIDINQIPTAAVERIEILLDGASAIYGSDAIAGVVNIILRRDFKGLEANASAGRNASHKNDYSATLTGGLGDLGSDKFNLFGTFDYYKRDLIELSDTPENGSRDLRYKLGGRNFTSLTGGGTWQQFLPTGAGGNLVAQQVYQATASCRGTVINGQQALAQGFINPTGLLDANGNFINPNSTQALQARASNTYCSQNFNNEFTAVPSTERYQFLGRGQYAVAPAMTAFAEVLLSRVNTGQTFQDPFFAGTTALQQTPVGLRPFTYNVNFAPGSAGNPFATTARYVGVFGDLGTRNQNITSDSGRFVGGLTYSIGTWDLDSALGYSRNTVTSTYTDYLSLAGVSGAFGIPTTQAPATPGNNAFTSTSSTYNLNNFTLNSDAVRNSIRAAPFERKSTSELEFVDTRASTEFAALKLPGGPLGMALGAEFRHESINDQPATIASTGGILGQGITATNGSRSSEAAYVEFRLPIFRNLESQLAGRYDHYSDYGSSYTPKVGFKYTPVSSVAMRANYGRGFRAPTLPEITPSVATSFVTVNDPVNPNTTTQVSSVSAGNAQLRPETSHSFNLGVVFEPVKEFSTSLDFYKIDYKNVVARPSAQSYVNASCAQGAGGPALPCTSTANVLRDPSTNSVVTVLRNFTNLSTRTTNGFDLDLRYSFPTTGLGKFAARATGTYIRTFKEEGIDFVGTNGGFNSYPRIKAASSVDWDYGPVKLTGRANYTQGWTQDPQRGSLLPASYFTPQDSRFQNGVLPNKTPDYVTFDFYGNYQLTKNFAIAGALVNAFNRHPPYDPGFTTTYFYDFSQFDVRGRQARLSVNYKL